MADKVDPQLAAAIMKHGAPTSMTPGFRLKPQHKVLFSNAEWACQHLVEKIGTPNIRFYLFQIDGARTASCAECRPNIENAKLVMKPR